MRTPLLKIQTIFIFVLTMFCLVTCRSVFASNWIKYGGTSEFEYFYDSDQIVTVKYKNEQGRISKGIRIRQLVNYTQPTFRADIFIFKQAIQSSVVIAVYDCYDPLAYDERIVYSSSKNDRGTLVHEYFASPANVEHLYSQIQGNKEIIEERRRKVADLADKARRNGQDPKRVVDEYLPSHLKTQETTERISFTGTQIEKIVRKFCSIAP